MPASLLMFILQCATWPSMSMLNVLYAKLYSSITAKNVDRHVIAFSGYFFATFHSSQVSSWFSLFIHSFIDIFIGLKYYKIEVQWTNGTSLGDVHQPNAHPCLQIAIKKCVKIIGMRSECEILKPPFKHGSTKIRHVLARVFFFI